MKELAQGIKVIDFSNGEYTLANRLRLSDGVRVANNLPGELAYCSHAIIPKKPWRELSESELDILSSDGLPEERGLWVSVITVPRLLIERFSVLKACDIKEDVDSWLNTKNGKKAIDQIIEFSSKLDISLVKPNRYGVGCNLPNQRTVTITGSCLEGLHVDDGDGLPLTARTTARNRLMVNLGAEPRYFLFVNLPLQVIYDFVSSFREDNSESIPGMSRIGLLFMQKFSNYPVVQLEIKPGEAYIAPTSNIIHDGSTVGTKKLDKIFTCLGKFRPSILR
ncbi:hypothetical protein [Candidatus Leptofilum sp.]|uniref:hypothetical protein n=1 Tax=Candidatus Leptofilum sp. TaxID=3241576 RepID=UPI003B5B9FD1